MAVLGVDGGQTAIRIRHSADDREIEVEGVSRQEGDTVASVASAVVEGWRLAGARPVDRVMLGLTTAPGDGLGSDRLCELVAGAVGAAEVWLTDDAVTSHAGALSGCPGVSIVAGTGVACLALPERGAARIIGGHGFLLGDEGGGFWIGRCGLSAALRAADGRGVHTLLAELAERRFGPLPDLHIRLHDTQRPIVAIAGFATDVLDAAARGDVIAEGILDEAARELLLLARSGAAWVGGEDIPVALGGRLLAGGGALRERLDPQLAESEPRMIARDPDGSALDGAIRLGLASDRGRYGELIHAWRKDAA
jgi:glucosamine kinase